jgi:acetolactate synthase-1/2/3 large subunit
MSEQPGLSNTRRTLSGGQAIAEMLKLAGIGPIFGIGGFQLLPFYEACRQLGLKHTLINDERSGAFAADAYAKVTNRPGCVDATLGPGATNLVTGLVESFNAGIPIIAIIGDATREHATKNMTQETRQLEILRPVRQGSDPCRGVQAHSGASAPGLRCRDLRPAWAGGDRCPRGRRAWRI